ncbi:unnamed protein product [Cylindrotheca closterium]|uniref:Uncharacterized protein n=1 Tax=Cylindrotheca closterium TaxID=2856 RepID=A0AAD2GB69_9STRA|nr:unnamed protein product [Cylindrotheca closterium]
MQEGNLLVSGMPVCGTLVILVSNQCLGFWSTGNVRIDATRRGNKPAIFPENLGALLLNERYCLYFDKVGNIIKGREEHYKAFKWFIANVLLSINHELTGRNSKQVYALGHQDFITQRYSPSDEAFALMLIANYEKRWRALVVDPTTDKKRLAGDEKYATRFSSSRRGYTKLPWGKEVVEILTQLEQKIELLRKVERTGTKLEGQVLADFEETKSLRSRRKKQLVYKHRPVVGGKLGRKMAERKRRLEQLMILS